MSDDHDHGPIPECGLEPNSVSGCIREVGHEGEHWLPVETPVSTFESAPVFKPQPLDHIVNAPVFQPGDDQPKKGRKK